MGKRSFFDGTLRGDRYLQDGAKSGNGVIEGEILDTEPRKGTFPKAGILFLVQFPVPASHAMINQNKVTRGPFQNKYYTFISLPAPSPSMSKLKKRKISGVGTLNDFFPALDDAEEEL